LGYILRSVILLGIIFGAAGCALINKPVKFVDDFIDSTFFPPYSGPKARLIIADPEIMTAKATPELGAGLRDLLVSGLTKSRRFQVEPPGNDDVARPQGLIVALKLLDFEPYGSGGKDGLGGGGSASGGTLESLLGSSINRSYITLDIRIVESNTSKVLYSQRISQQAAGNVPEEKYEEGKALGQGLAMYSGTSMQEAIEKCMRKAVEYIIQKVPDKYYTAEDKNGKKKTQGKT
jgi:hypothetical protein